MGLDRLLKYLNCIPHLNLLKKYDIDKLNSEVVNISQFKDYQTQHKTSKEQYEKTWSGVSLYGTKGDPYLNLTENSSSRDMAITSVGKKCPYMMSIMEDLGTEDQLSRVMRIAPKSNLNFHSHVKHHKQPEHILTVHVPIVVPPNFEYIVKHPKTEKLYKETYKEGQAYVFNSYHPHNVYNYSEIYRISIMVYMNLKKKKCFDIVKKAMMAYTGPKII